MQRAQSQAQGPFVQSMLGVSEIFKGAKQNVFLRPSGKPWMQVHQRIVRRIKVDVTPAAILPAPTEFGSLVGQKFYAHTQ